MHGHVRKPQTSHRLQHPGVQLSGTNIVHHELANDLIRPPHNLAPVGVDGDGRQLSPGELRSLRSLRPLPLSVSSALRTDIQRAPPPTHVRGCTCPREAVACHLPERGLQAGPFLLQGGLGRAGTGGAGTQVHHRGTARPHLLRPRKGIRRCGPAAGIEGILREIEDPHDMNIACHSAKVGKNHYLCTSIARYYGKKNARQIRSVTHRPAAHGRCTYGTVQLPLCQAEGR